MSTNEAQVLEMTTVAREILLQVRRLGLPHTMAVYDAEEVKFVLRGCRSVTVSYHEGSDTYTVRQYQFHMKTDAVKRDRTVEGVYVDQLPQFWSW